MRSIVSAANGGGPTFGCGQRVATTLGKAVDRRAFEMAGMPLRNRWRLETLGTQAPHLAVGCMDNRPSYSAVGNIGDSWRLEE